MGSLTEKLCTTKTMYQSLEKSLNYTVTKQNMSREEFVTKFEK